MSPQLGQGANLALTEAWELSEVIGREGVGASALFDFQVKISRRAAYYQWLSGLLSPLFQSDYDWIGAVRDALISPLGRNPLIEREMLKTFSGLKNGLLSSDRAI